jgi:(p)ppGpp synthase/HD superfamily hydrolase
MDDAGRWLEHIQELNPRVDLQALRSAYELAARAHDGQKRASGEPYLQHCLAVAQMLAELHLDTETITAALLHDVPEDTDVPLAEIRQQFGEQVALLVDGVTKLKHIDQISSLSQRNLAEYMKAESLRKMFLVMVDDPRVVLIKLADRLHNMRTLSDIQDSERRRRIARETLDIFAPLAGRLGIYQVKWELPRRASRMPRSWAGPSTSTPSIRKWSVRGCPLIRSTT